MEESKLLTRQQCSDILESRGYVKADYPGIWLDPEKNKIVWFWAVCREKLIFDKKDLPCSDIVVVKK